jgi:hypothetical protein
VGKPLIRRAWKKSAEGMVAGSTELETTPAVSERQKIVGPVWHEDRW